MGPLPFVLVLAMLTGCASPELSGTKSVSYGQGQAPDENSRQISQTELQEELQRFTTQFLARMNQAAEPLSERGDDRIRVIAMSQVLVYSSSALDISSGMYPEVNLLDMLAFVRLSRDLLEDYWRPHVYGAQADPLIEAFRVSETELIRIADLVSTKAQQQRLFKIIDSWRREHPDQVRVEGVRLSAFSTVVGRLASERAEEAGGLLASIKGAVSSADQALLLANRSLFLVQRLPFLMRLQARVGSRQMLTDSMEHLEQAGTIAQDTDPFIQDLATLTERSVALMDRMGPLMSEFRKNFPWDSHSTLAQRLSTGERITENLMKLVDGVSTVRPEVALGRVDELLWKFTAALVLVGAAWALFGWGGYFLIRRVRRPAQLQSKSERDSAA